MSARLSTKLIAAQMIALVVALSSIGLTLLISWKLEGSAAAINDAGSLRMRSYRIAYLAEQAREEGYNGPTVGLLRREIGDFDQVLETLKRGDPGRPLFLPDTDEVRARLADLYRDWQALGAPLRDATLLGKVPALERGQVERFVGTVNSLVIEVEAAVTRATALLRLVQLGLVALAIGGAVALVYLSFLFIVRPVVKIKEGIERMAAADFAFRLPSTNGDEFGMVAAGFNHMADQLQNLYSNLEARVAAKTKSLAEQNERLATLYDMAAFLNSPHELEELGRGFLRRLMTATGAAAGSIRLVQREPVGAGDAEENRVPDELAMYLTEGLDSRFVENERCLRADACACGDAMSRAAPIVHLVSGRRVAVTLPYCREAGFATVTAFPIVAQGETIGIYNLFFREARELAVDERHMLETLGQHLGVTMLSRRLAAREREMAISEERNLLAQELHDSIAQSLAFLNLQVQMLRDAIGKGNFERAREDLDGVQAGVQETYSDVRELLTHFRTRLGEGSLEEAIRSLLHRFEHQTGLATRLRVSGAGLSPPTEAQLQILHIAQEALSNARKHAEARTIEIDIVKGAVYRLVVRDDGRGFDPDANRGADHVGLLIMRERAQRVGASLAIRSAPGGGAEITVELPLEQRQAA